MADDSRRLLHKTLLGFSNDLGLRHEKNVLTSSYVAAGTNRAAASFGRGNYNRVSNTFGVCTMLHGDVHVAMPEQK